MQPHPIPKFVAHRLNFRPGDERSLVEDNTLFLWRFRPEWSQLSRDSGYATLSRAELARIKNYPNPALGKRYAVARACLREILAGLTGLPASDLPLYEDREGRLRLDPLRSPLSIATVYAGAWVLVAVARANVGLAISMVTPAGSSLGSSFNDAAIADAQPLASHTHHTRQHVRRASLADAADKPLFDVTEGLLQDDSPSVVLDAHKDGVWHLLDLPMPGTMLASVAVACPVAAVHGFGWVSYEASALNAAKAPTRFRFAVR
ncbi:hypothetical protein [Paraburkholderia sp. J76]|uniref:4'-phosphopantetheinyl transferase family protein n=1 Tax=Paraburkholderia sp. J76 TaxID=2805439 RepID=UPI002ABE2B70|nr:hypothetical protein [Paraburkholderia sp. J76]